MKKTIKKISNNPFVSIIIPLHWGLKKENYQRFVKELTYFLELDYDKYEILLISDIIANIPISSKRLRFLTTPKKTASPAEKRDYALKKAKGELCAFIDDDAYPDRCWIKNAIYDFKKYNVVAVGGPGVTPPDNTFWQKIGGYVIESYLCSGGVQYRFYGGIKKKLFVNDYPAYNLFIRTDVLKKVGGFGSAFYGGEDTYLCMKLIKEGEILYDSEVLVYHHRRSFPVAHLKQIANVGVHRGYFFKAFPETSRHLFYTLPTVLTVCFIGGIVLSLVFRGLFLYIFLLSFIGFLLIGALSVKSHKTSWVSSGIASFGIVLTHFVYGMYFIKGLLTNKLVN